MKLKATGIIEPDFKIKEGKKSQGEDDLPKKKRGRSKKRKKLQRKNESSSSSLEKGKAIPVRRLLNVESNDLTGEKGEKFFKSKPQGRKLRALFTGSRKLSLNPDTEADLRKH